jgi:hypothetical protein
MQLVQGLCKTWCNVIVILKCGCIAVVKRSIEEANGIVFAVYAGDKIRQVNIVMP